MAFQLNTHGKDIEDIEKESGGFLTTPGWYRALVTEIIETPGKPEIVCRYTVNDGPHAGSVATQWITTPEGFAGDDTKVATAENRLSMLAQRLGLWDGVTADPVVDFEEAIGREVVLLVDPGRPNKTTGMIGQPGIAYAGVFPLDHPKIPEAIRKTLRLPAARSDGKTGTDMFTEEKPGKKKAAAAKATPKSAAYDVTDL